MRLLCLDTSTVWLTVALVVDGAAVASFGAEVGIRHGEQLTTAVAQVLPVGRPDAVAVGVGPGPFTSLRVGIATAAALADGWGVPAYPACSLDLLAAPGVAVVQDARRKEVYLGLYDDSAARVGDPLVLTPAAAAGVLGGRRVVGNGAFAYPSDFDVEADAPRWPDAARLWDLVPHDLSAPAPLTPLYLRRPDAVEAAGRRPSTLQPTAQPKA